MAVHAQRPDRPIATLGRCGRRIAPPVPMGCAHIRLHAGLRIWAKATSSAESARTGWFVAGAGRVGMRFCRARTAAGMPDVLPTRVLLSVPAHLTIRPALRGLLTPLLEGTQRPVGDILRMTREAADRPLRPLEERRQPAPRGWPAGARAGTAPEHPGRQR